MAETERRPTWAEIDLNALAHNYRLLVGLTDAARSRVPLIPVIKADAYGHGAVAAARRLAGEGANLLAVAIVEEGAALREAGITQDILVLEGAWPGQEADVLRHRLIPAVYSPDGIRRLQRAACGTSPVPVHIKIDTGMARLGARWDALGPVIEALRDSSSLEPAGGFSHFASADEPDPEYTLEQIRRFELSLAALAEVGIRPGVLHIANSAGLLHVPESRRWAARPGIALYGYPPLPELCALPLRRVLTLKSRIGHIHQLQPGESVGYNRRFVAARPTRAGTIPAGYADGYGRSLTGRARVSIRGQWAPLLGAVSMDLIVADLTDIPEASEGDEVTLLGSAAGGSFDADDWAAGLGTITYEVLCGISARVPRISGPQSQVSPPP